MLVDSHCHLNCLDLQNFPEGLSQALAAARANDISYMLCVSIELEHYPEVLKIAEQHEKIFASVGVHPNEYDGHDPSVAELIELANHPKVIAIGETGLDYYRSEPHRHLEQQAKFRRHIAAARTTQKPLIIHMREATADTLHILAEERAEQIGGVMHCFTENWQVAQQALALNFYISISGIVTFKSATQLQEVAQKVPLDKLLIETDAPYLAPVPHRGKSNQPAFLKHTAQFIAELRGIEYAELAKQTTENFFSLFKPPSTI